MPVEIIDVVIKSIKQRRDSKRRKIRRQPTVEIIVDGIKSIEWRKMN